jgi:hypothetical protein
MLDELGALPGVRRHRSNSPSKASMTTIARVFHVAPSDHALVAG